MIGLAVIAAVSLFMWLESDRAETITRNLDRRPGILKHEEDGSKVG
jgi:hypothetical protein